MKIKKGDQAVVISGKEKGKKGKVTVVIPGDNRVVIENVNVVSRHRKPRSAQDKGGIMKIAAPIEASNVMVLCPACGKAADQGRGRSYEKSHQSSGAIVFSSKKKNRIINSDNYLNNNRYTKRNR